MDRFRLADELERLIAEADGPPVPARGAAVPILRDEVRAARRDLLLLAAALRGERAPSPRSVEAAEELLTDGGGPVFVPHPRGALQAAAFDAAFDVEAD